MFFAGVWDLQSTSDLRSHDSYCRVPKVGVFKGGGGNWGTLRIPREDC